MRPTFFCGIISNFNVDNLLTIVNHLDIITFGLSMMFFHGLWPLGEWFLVCRCTVDTRKVANKAHHMWLYHHALYVCDDYWFMDFMEFLEFSLLIWWLVGNAASGEAWLIPEEFKRRGLVDYCKLRGPRRMGEGNGWRDWEGFGAMSSFKEELFEGKTFPTE